MDEERFPHDDRLRSLATDARDAIHNLTIELHDWSCDETCRRS